MLLNLAREHKTTVIIVTHNNQLSYLADKIIHIKNGQIEDVEINRNPMDIDQIEW